MEEYKKKTNTGDDVIVRTQPIAPAKSSGPRHAPTAVVFGWFASKARHVAKYTSLFENMGYNTVQVTAPFSVVFAFNPRSVAMYLLSIMRILACDERLTSGGVIFQMFSNGGAVAAPQISHFLAGRYDDTITADDMAVVDVTRKHIAAVIFDSSPVYLRASSGAQAIIVGLGVTSTLVSTMISAAFMFMCWVQYTIFIDLPRYFWDGLRHADYGCPEMYMYSRVDRFLDVTLLESLIEERKREGRDVHVLSSDDAEHVKLLMKMPEKYVESLRNIHERGVNEWRRRAALPPWDASPTE